MFDRAPDLEAVMGLPITAALQHGLSNHVLRVEAENGIFFVRTGGGVPALPVDRFIEAHNLTLAAEAGVAVAPVYVRPETGILVTRALEGPGIANKDLPERLANLLAVLHGSGAVFRGTIEPQRVFQAYLEDVRPHLARINAETLLPGLDGVLRRLASVFDGGRITSGHARVPSHGDVSPGNWLASGGQLWLIDWEFSGMADPCWDLAYAIVENAFDGAAENRFLRTYQKERGMPVSRRDLQAMKAQCNAISALWALSQFVSGRNPEAFGAIARKYIADALRSLHS